MSYSILKKAYDSQKKDDWGGFALENGTRKYTMSFKEWISYELNWCHMWGDDYIDGTDGEGGKEWFEMLDAQYNKLDYTKTYDHNGRESK